MPGRVRYDAGRCARCWTQQIARQDAARARTSHARGLCSSANADAEIAIAPIGAVTTLHGRVIENELVLRPKSNDRFASRWKYADAPVRSPAESSWRSTKPREKDGWQAG